MKEHSIMGVAFYASKEITKLAQTREGDANDLANYEMIPCSRLEVYRDGFIAHPDQIEKLKRAIKQTQWASK